MASNQDCVPSSHSDVPLIMASNQDSTISSHSDMSLIDAPSATSNEQIAGDLESATAATAISHSDMPLIDVFSATNNEQLPADDDTATTAATTTTITEVNRRLVDKFGAEATVAYAPEWLATIATNIGHQSLVDILERAATEAIETALKRTELESHLKDYVAGKQQEILNEILSSLPSTSKGKELPSIGPAMTDPIAGTPSSAEDKPATGKKRKAASAGLEGPSAGGKKTREYDHTLPALRKTQANVKLDVGTIRFICALYNCPVNENRADELSRHYRSASDEVHAARKLGGKPYFEVHKLDYKNDEGLKITAEATTAQEWYDMFDKEYTRAARADPNYQLKPNGLRTKKKNKQQVEDEGDADGATDQETDVDSDDGGNDFDGDDDGDGNEAENGEAGTATSPEHDGETGKVDKGKGKAIPDAYEDNDPAPAMDNNDTAMAE
jgi:hypothetical protein